MEVTGRFFIKTRENQLVCLISFYQRKRHYYCMLNCSLWFPCHSYIHRGLKYMSNCTSLLYLSLIFQHFEMKYLYSYLIIFQRKSYYSLQPSKYKVHILQVIISYFHKKIRNIKKHNIHNFFEMGSEIHFSQKYKWLWLFVLVKRPLISHHNIVLTCSKAFAVVNSF